MGLRQRSYSRSPPPQSQQPPKSPPKPPDAQPFNAAEDLPDAEEPPDVEVSFQIPPVEPGFLERFTEELEHTPDPQQPSVSSAWGDLRERETVRGNAVTRMRERRRGWLDAHPEYFDADHLERGEPELYNRLVRRWQTREERLIDEQAEDMERVLEHIIPGGETRIIEVEGNENEDEDEDEDEDENDNGNGNGNEDRHDPRNRTLYGYEESAIMTGNDGVTAEPSNREDAQDLWRRIMGMRFRDGKDTEFDYDKVDFSSEWDDQEEEERRREEAYFENL
ncbi:MAG: hypothetical protein M1820_002125 [Bogoriella megaspora]|nr:MAG: hypothetical protein M1820_002125 [Bogoriella megaspora]